MNLKACAIHFTSLSTLESVFNRYDNVRDGLFAVRQALLGDALATYQTLDFEEMTKEDDLGPFIERTDAEVLSGEKPESVRELDVLAALVQLDCGEKVATEAVAGELDWSKVLAYRHLQPTPSFEEKLLSHLRTRQHFKIEPICQVTPQKPST